MEVHDIPAIVGAVRRVAPDAVIMIDNTWAAGVLFKALDFGIDISIQGRNEIPDWSLGCDGRHSRV